MGRNEALRKSHALSTVLSKHNISFDVSKADMGGLKIENGQVSGEFSYTPPDPSRGKPPPVGDDAKSKPITMESIKQMTPDQINAQWKEVSAVLEAEA